MLYARAPSIVTSRSFRVMYLTVSVQYNYKQYSLFSCLNRAKF